jgi:hypothetical protein
MMAKAINSLSSRNKFAKRHYEAIALAMQEAKCTAQNDSEFKGVIYAVLELADVFASDNGQFIRERFIAACQPGANVRARTNGGSRS